MATWTWIFRGSLWICDKIELHWYSFDICWWFTYDASNCNLNLNSSHKGYGWLLWGSRNWSFIASRCLWYSFRDSNLFKSQELTGTGAVGLAKLILHCDGSSFCVVLMLLVMCWTIAWKEVNDSGSHCTSTKRARASAELVTIPLNTHATEVVLTVRAFLRLLTC